MPLLVLFYNCTCQGDANQIFSNQKNFFTIKKNFSLLIRREGRKEGRQAERKEGRRRERKEGRQAGRQEGRKEGTTTVDDINPALT